MTDLKQSLTTFGFTSTEADVYLGLLSTHEAKVGEITEVTGITRTQLYPLLDRMTKKGFIKEIGTGPIRYIAITPSKLVSKIHDNRQDEIKKLIELKSELEAVRPVKTVQNFPYKTQMITGEENIKIKGLELFKNAGEEVISTGVVERPFMLHNVRKYEGYKEKMDEGLKVICYFSVKPQNIGRLDKIKKMLIAFYDFDKKEYNTALYIESPSLAESFAEKHISQIRTNPLEGELHVDIYGTLVRGFILPKDALNGLPKKEQFKVGYNIGKYMGEQTTRGRSVSLKAATYNVQWEMRLGAWGNVKTEYVNKDRIRLWLKNCVVPCEVIKGTLLGALEQYGKFTFENFNCLNKKCGEIECDIVRKG